MIEISNVVPASLRWVVQQNDRVDFYAEIANGPGALALRTQFLLISGTACVGTPLPRGYRLAGSHVHASTARRLQREHPRGVFFRLRSDRPELPQDAQFVMLEKPVVIPGAPGSGRDPITIAGVYMAVGGAPNRMSGPIRVRQWDDRFNQPAYYLDFPTVLGLRPHCPIDVGARLTFRQFHDPMLADMEPNPALPNCITDGIASIPLWRPPLARWAHDPIQPFRPLRRVRSVLWGAMCNFLVGKTLMDCVELLLPTDPAAIADLLDHGGDEEEDDGTADGDEDLVGAGGSGVPLQPGPCYPGAYTALRFVADRFEFECRRVRIVAGNPVTTTVWLYDFPVYGRALRAYLNRADGRAYANGTRTGIGAPDFWRMHSGNWIADTEAYLAQFGTPA